MVNDTPTAALDRTLIALADPTRRAILERLRAGEARVTDLAAPFALSLNAVSKHIRMLERAHLVRRRRQWREHWVSADPAPLALLTEWLDRHRDFWNVRLERLGTALSIDTSDELLAPKIPPSQRSNDDERSRRNPPGNHDSL
jgi:DNA-binding transcriptional ArsR family regulator